MRILVITPAAAPTVGGLETVLSELERNWTQLGHQVVTQVTVSPSLRDQPRARRFTWTGAAREALRADTVLIVNATFRGLPYALLRPRRSLMQHHSDYSQDREQSSRLAYALRRLWVAHQKGVAVSPWLAARLPTRPARLHTIPNPLPAGDDALAEPTTVSSDEGRYTFALVGRLVEEKGFADFLAALAQLQHTVLKQFPGVSVCIAGDGPDRQRLERSAKEAGLGKNIEWRGALAPAEVRSVLSRTQFLVVPSRRESFGMVALEGLACGARLIVSDAQNLGVYFGQVARTYVSGDIDALATALGDALLRPASVGLPASDTRVRGLLAASDSLQVAEAYLNVMRLGQTGRRSGCV